MKKKKGSSKGGLCRGIIKNKKILKNSVCQGLFKNFGDKNLDITKIPLLWNFA